MEKIILRCVDCGRFLGTQYARWSTALWGWRCESCYERMIEES